MSALLDRPVAVGPRSHRSRRWLIAIATFVLLSLVVWLVEFSSVLGVKNVEVVGDRLLSAAQVRQAAAITPGTPLARLDTSAVERRIGALPSVRSVKVTTSYPNSVRITIDARQAVGYRSIAGTLSEVDQDNVAFVRVTRAPKGLPRLDTTGDAAVNADIAAVAGALGRALAAKVARIGAGTAETITLTMADGRTVLWGGTDRGRDKAALLPALLGQPGRYFDVSDPDVVISRPGN